MLVPFAPQALARLIVKMVGAVAVGVAAGAGVVGVVGVMAVNVPAMGW